MKPIFLRLLMMLLLSSSLHFVQAQTKTDETAVRECLENYMSGDGTRIEKAFHPTAFMKYIDAATGEFKDVPIAEYIARVKASTIRNERKIGIESLNVEGTAAHAKIKI
jgi:pyocin large subunit-like protein